MAQVAIYTTAGKKNGTIDIDDAVFAAKTNTPLVYQVYTAIEANARAPWAKTKDRSEVRGGGRKPWKQKGTGRARHGSNRSPIWSGGGVTFGPDANRNYKQKINKKMKRSALKVSLSEKVTGESLAVIENFTDISGKTKEFVSIKDEMKLPGTMLLVVSDATPELTRAIRNIPKFNMQRAIDLNVVDVLHHKHVIFTKDAVETLTERLTA